MPKLNNPKTDRLSWDEMFMNLAVLASKRTACKFHETGTVFVDKYRRIISMGYNGPTEGDYHCIEHGCAKVDGDPITGKLVRCRGAHAEINAIINAQDTTRLRGATCYTVLLPCYDCMKALNNAGIKEIVYYEIYERLQTGGEKVEEENEIWELARKRGIIVRKYGGTLLIDSDNESEPKKTKKEIYNNVPVQPLQQEQESCCDLPIPKTQKKHPEYQYLDLMQEIVDKGIVQTDAGTGVKTYSLFGKQMRFDLSEGFPLLTTKKVYWKGVLEELYWFLSGQSNIKYLVDKNVHIWDDYPYKIYREKMLKGELPQLEKDEFIKKIAEDYEFAEKFGELKNIYGEMWRRWPAKRGRTVDQVQWVVDELKKDPDAHNALVNSWNPEYLYNMALPEDALRFPICHNMYQCNVKDGKLSLHLYQRSADIFLGVPFNIGSYALLTHILAKATGNEPGDFIHTFGDVHIYENHFDQVKEQLAREPMPLPTLKIDPEVEGIDDFLPEHAKLENYEAHPSIKAELSATGGVANDDWKKFVKKDNQQ